MGGALRHQTTPTHRRLANAESNHGGAIPPRRAQAHQPSARADATEEYTLADGDPRDRARPGKDDNSGGWRGTRALQTEPAESSGRVRRQDPPATGQWPSDACAARPAGTSTSRSPSPRRAPRARSRSESSPCRPCGVRALLAMALDLARELLLAQVHRVAKVTRAILRAQGHTLQGHAPPPPGCRQWPGCAPRRPPPRGARTPRPGSPTLVNRFSTRSRSSSVTGRFATLDLDLQTPSRSVDGASSTLPRCSRHLNARA